MIYLSSLTLLFPSHTLLNSLLFQFAILEKEDKDKKPISSANDEDTIQTTAANTTDTTELTPKSDLLLLRIVEAKGMNLSSKAGGKGSSFYKGLPYVVAEFDKNEIVVDALGGDLDSPVWKYRVHL